jgi:LmbE family N-acetylglucosaminyl deacetylase
MKEALARALAEARRPIRLDLLPLPPGLSIAVLSPHPDDFDCIAVTLRRLRDGGHRLSVAVLSGGASGVEDRYASPPTPACKAALRRAEQEASCRLFGLPEDALSFLPLAEDAEGEPADTPGNRDLVAGWLGSGHDLAFLPHGHDAKGGHRNVYALFRGVAAARRLSTAAILNRDPKTLALRIDAYTPYGAEDAAWKARLLRLHDSQQQRNLNTRGRGFDERILDMDRRSAAGLGAAEAYAEAFEVEFTRDGEFQPLELLR